jgi:hypothetical protein
MERTQCDKDIQVRLQAVSNVPEHDTVVGKGGIESRDTCTPVRSLPVPNGGGLREAASAPAMPLCSQYDCVAVARRCPAQALDLHGVSLVFPPSEATEAGPLVVSFEVPGVTEHRPSLKYGDGTLPVTCHLHLWVRGVRLLCLCVYAIPQALREQTGFEMWWGGLGGEEIGVQTNPILY